jgi:hypothetical protein
MLIDLNSTTPNGGKQGRTKADVAPQDWLHHNIVRGRKEVFSEVIDLTPEIARLLLDSNVANRSINAGTLSAYIADIREDRWDFNGESLKIATDGMLNDGQHRCWAVVEANKSIRVIITFGVPRDSRMTLDQGKARSTADYLIMDKGVKYATQVTAASRVLLMERRGLRGHGMKSGLTRLAVRDEFKANEQELNAAAYFCCGKHKNKILGGSGPAIAALVLMRRISPNADDFMAKFITGEDLKNGDPILSVRNRMMNTPGLVAMDKLNILMRAFDAWLEGRTLSKVYIKTRAHKTGAR